MKVAELFKQGHTKMRLSHWEPSSYIELFPVKDGYGPWATIYGIGSQGEQVPVWELKEDNWEPFEA